jgi:hypothetical protein
MVFHRFKKTLKDLMRVKKDKQRQQFSKNEVELDSAKDQLVPKK